MPEINVKSFNELTETIEKLADGTKIHNSENGFPPQIQENILRDMKNSIEDKREAYEQAISKARQLYNEYNSDEKRISGIISRYKKQIYGFYGDSNKVVSDFGMKPYKIKKGRTKKAK